MITKKDLLQFRRIDKRTGCWLWVPQKNPKKYGKYKGEGVHRHAFRLWKHEPGRKFVLHKSDNPPCFNPRHLFLGTQKDNIRDAVRKGRMIHGDRHHFRQRPWLVPRGKKHGLYLHPEKRARGSRHGEAKVTEGDVVVMRRLYAAGAILKTIAIGFGLSISMVHAIVTRQRWTHVA